jgi:Flp pilus assembly pilin Flp
MLVYIYQSKGFIMDILIDFLGATLKICFSAHEPRRSESGQGIVEYALIFVLVVVLLVVLLYFFGDRVEALYQSIVTDLAL